MCSDLVIECHQIQLCDIECLIRYEYKSGSRQTEIIDFNVSSHLYVFRLYSALIPQLALPQRLNNLLVLPQQATQQATSTATLATQQATSTAQQSTLPQWLNKLLALPQRSTSTAQHATTVTILTIKL
jgi:hypothetical protein